MGIMLNGIVRTIREGVNLKINRYVFSKNYRFANGVCKKNGFDINGITREEKKEIDAFWSQYGIKFPDYSWFKMFYAVTGIKKPSFIPHPIAHVLIKKYNLQAAVAGWDDKNVYELLLPNVKFPKALCHFIRGNFYDSKWNSYNDSPDSLKDLAESIFNGLGENKSLIIKKTTRTAFGKGVQKVTIKDVSEIIELLNSLKGQSDFMLQKCIKQHAFLSQFNESSVNVFRVITFRCNSEIHFLSASLRFGIEGHFTDVAFVDGEEIVNVVGVDAKTGEIKENLYDVNGRKDFTRLSEIKERKVPYFDEMVKMAVDGHSRLFHFDFVGWDFTIDSEGQVVCVEFNIVSPGTQLYQFAHGPLLGNYVADYLEPLKDNSVRKRIPREFRL